MIRLFVRTLETVAIACLILLGSAMGTTAFVAIVRQEAWPKDPWQGMVVSVALIAVAVRMIINRARQGD